MRIEVDWMACEANGICAALAPHIFAVNDDEVLEIKVSDVDPADLDAVEAAVRRCPKQALSLTG